MPSQKKAITLDYLKNAAQYYLARYASSKENLRNILTRKVERRLYHPDTGNIPDTEEQLTAEQYAPLIDETVALCEKAGLLNDRSFAEIKTASLQARGTSQRMIRQKLTAKGIDNDIIRQVLDEAAECGHDDRQAARKYAKRRGLGCYRTKNRDDNSQKDMSKMMRAGFSYEDSRHALAKEE